MSSAQAWLQENNKKAALVKNIRCHDSNFYWVSDSCSQQLFSAALLSSSSQQPFSAAFLSSLPQQPFSAAFLSSHSQQPFSAIILLWSGVGGQLLSSSCCGQGLVVTYYHHLAVVRGWWSAVHTFFRRTLSQRFREKMRKSCFLSDMSCFFFKLNT